MGPRKALVLEDEPLLNRMFRKSLEQLGLQVWSATTVREAEALWRQHRPMALMLLDVQLPDGVSLELLRRYSEILRQEGTQVILLTAEPRYRHEAEEMGLEFFLEKPVSLAMLRHLVARLLQLPFVPSESSL